MNLLSLECVVDEYWVRMDTCIDDVIYFQSKTGRCLLWFQQCCNRKLYYLDLENPNMDKACLFTPIDKKRARAVQKLQEMCESPSDADFIQALEHNKIPGVDFTKRDIRIAKDLLRYKNMQQKER